MAARGRRRRARKGQPLYSLESEKSVQEIEAPASGKLKIIAAAWRNVQSRRGAGGNRVTELARLGACDASG